MERRAFPVRPIVPVVGRPVPALAATTPHLTYNGGDLLTAVQVFTIFWGAAWQQMSNNTIPASINSFFDSILTSSLITLLKEYDVTGQSIGPGTRIGSTTIADSEPGGTSGQVTDAQIRSALQGWISGTIPPSEGNTLYFVYLPPGVTVTDPQGGQSCTQLCGYHFYSTGPGGVKSIGVTNTDWRRTWSTIVPGNFGGGTGLTDLLFYDPQAGQGEFWRTDGHGNVSQIGVTNTDWRRTWSIIVPGNFGGGTGLTDLLFYDSQAGLGDFWRTDGHGNVSQIGVTNTDWRRSWSMIVPGNFGGGSGFTDLLFYDRQAGLGDFWRTDGHGNVSQIGATNSGWRTSWALIIPGDYGSATGRTDLLFYDGPTGQAEFFHSNGHGGVQRIGWTTVGWRTSWSIIVPGSFGGGTGQSDLLFYDPQSGQGEFYETNGESPAIFYAVEPFPDCTACLPSPLDSLQSLTTTSSHELCEAITDPLPGDGWYDGANGEIGDICAWLTDTIDGFTVQKEWSNVQKACVIAPAAGSVRSGGVGEVRQST